MQTTSGYERYRGDELRAFVVGVLEHFGMPHTDAVVGAEALVHADELVIDSHGVAHFANAGAYVPGLREGKVDAKASPVVLQESPSTAVMDGRHGFGPVAATRGMELAIDKARATGAG